MNIHTHLEDLSNELFFEIFDYLHALEIFTGFASLNQRISSILKFIPLRIIILPNYCRQHIDFLSSHLTYHAHQVISLDIHDTICDYSSVISLLFNQHNFTNLQSCVFGSISPSTKFGNIFKQIESLNRLVTFTVHESDLNENDKCDLTRMILMHKSSSLSSMILKHSYDYVDISNYISISPNLTTLYLRIHGSLSAISIHSILVIFRLCHGIRHLGLIVEHNSSVQNDHVK
jgi:hypothetical protein